MTHFKFDDESSFDPQAEYGREVLFEVIFIGNVAKVTAIDVETGVEVSIIGPPNATQYSLKMNAMRKLLSVLNKMHSEAEPQNDWLNPPGKPGRYA